MVGFCFDDDKQGKSCGKRKSIHEACKQTSKIPSNTTYLELEDYEEEIDGNTLVSTDDRLFIYGTVRHFVHPAVGHF